MGCIFRGTESFKGPRFLLNSHHLRVIFSKFSLKIHYYLENKDIKPVIIYTLSQVDLIKMLPS